MSKHEKLLPSPKEILLDMARLEVDLLQASLNNHILNEDEKCLPVMQVASEYLASITWKHISQTTIGKNFCVYRMYGSSDNYNDITTGLLFSSPKHKLISLHRDGDFPTLDPFNVDMSFEQKSNTLVLTGVSVETDVDMFTYPSDS